MNNILIKQMSSDLKIYRYNSESNEGHGNRLIYTALAAWARILLLGKSYTDLSDENQKINIDYNSIDIMHIKIRLSQIAYGMLISIPHCKRWNHNGSIEEQGDKLANEIIDKLVFCYELSPLNNTRRLASSPVRYAQFENCELILGEVQWKDINQLIFSIGLGRWRQAKKSYKNYIEVFDIPNYIYNEYYDALLSSALWKEVNLEGQYKIFEVGTGICYSKAWYDVKTSNIPKGISLLKNIEIKDSFFLVKRHEEKIYTARLDKWYYEENEIYRIMYILDKHNGTPAVFKVKDYGDYVVLYCNSKLPNCEMRILLMSSWPNRFYNDMYYRIVPKLIWNNLEEVFANLGIIEYTNI